MSRNDASLYSGLSSPKKQAIEKAKAEEPAKDVKAEAVLSEIAKMKHDVISVENVLLDDTMSEEQKLHRIERLKGDYDILAELERRMKKLLGVKHG